MRQVAIIALSALKEHSRKRLILFVAVASVLVMVALIYLVTSGGAQETFRSRSVGFIFMISGSVLGFFALLVSLSVSVGNVGPLFSSGEATLLLARPIRRAHIVLGRLLASSIFIAGMSATIALELQIVQVVARQSTPGLIWGDWAVRAFNLIVISAIVTAFSAVSSTPMITAIVGYFANSAITGIAFLNTLAESQAGFPSALSSIARVLWYVTPKFLYSPFSPGGSQMGGLTSSSNNSIGLVLWAVSYLLGLIMLAIFLAERKEA